LLVVTGLALPAFGDFTVLHSFSGGLNGLRPSGGLEVEGTKIYGSTQSTVFSLNTDGTGHTVLTTSSGRAPVSVVGSKLFGFTGDEFNPGTLFWMNTDGTGFQVLHTFTGVPSDGGHVQDKMLRAGSVFYGTTSGALPFHPGNNGTVFKINTDGTGYSVIHEFDGLNGQAPNTPLLIGSTLYAGSEWGGFASSGTFFSVGVDGSSFTSLKHFNGGSDGANPVGSLVHLAGKLYGVTNSGTNFDGRLFAINPDGTDFQVLHTFSGGAANGEFPAALTMLGGKLIGTTGSGGASNNGTIFSINPNGTDFQLLHSFAGGALGRQPVGDLTLVGSTIYGATRFGGTGDFGTLWTFVVPEPSSYVLAVLALVGLVAWKRKWRGA
jgi:uncharacterized repeat protein (TIGR03803 family)